jgi:hypothetical protein
LTGRSIELNITPIFTILWRLPVASAGKTVGLARSGGLRFDNGRAAHSLDGPLPAREMGWVVRQARRMV